MIAVYFVKLYLMKLVPLEIISQNFRCVYGQTLNLDMSETIFGKNTRLSIERNICRVINISPFSSSSPYLGLPSSIGRNKTALFSYIDDRVSSKIQVKEKVLSRAGKENLLKDVVTIILACVMSCFMIPKKLGNQIEAKQKGFW